jgi:hypothetical protein
MRSIVRRTMILALGVALAGCGSAASPSPSAPGNESPSPPTAAPTTTPPASPRTAPPASPDGPLAVVGGDLRPGRYRSTTTGLTVEFELAEAGWIGAEDIPETGFALVRPGIEGGVTVTHFPGEVFSEPCSPDATEPIDASAEAFVGWLAAHPELDAAEPEATTLGGHPATQLDVSAAVGEECPDFPRIWLWVLPTVGDFHLDEGEAARFIAADVGETTLVVVIETFDPSQQDALLEASEPLLDSMTVAP